MSYVPEQTNWNIIVRRDGPKLFRYFRARFEQQEASDLVQEVLLRMVRKERDAGLQHEHGSFTAYALGIAHFVAREAYKKKKRLKEDVLSDHDEIIDSVSLSDTGSIDDISLDERLIEFENIKLLRSAIRKLPLPSQEILTLLIERDLNLQNIAEIMNLPLNTIKSHIYRSKIRLKFELTQLRQTEGNKGRDNERQG